MEYSDALRGAPVRVVALLGLVLVLSGPAAAEPRLDELRDRGEVAAAYVHEYPFGFLSRDGRSTGEGIRVAQAVFEELGVERVNARMTERPSLVLGLREGRWDMVASGLRITPRHCDEVIFSQPTYRTGQAFLVRAGNPLRLNSYDALRETEGATLGVIDASVQREYARIEEIPATRIEEFPNDDEMLSALVAGRIDAAAGTRIAIQGLARRGGDQVQSAEPFITPVYGMVYGAFAFHPDDEALRDAVDGVLDDFIGSEEHLELVSEFGISEVNMPGPLSVEELCDRDIPTAFPE